MGIFNFTRKPGAIFFAVILVLIAIGVFVFGKDGKIFNPLQTASAGESAIDFLNSKLLSGNDKATLVSVTEESGVYKVVFSYKNSEKTAFMTKDGKLFFSAGISTDYQAPVPAPSSSAKKTANSAKTCEELKKTGDSQTEIFIMSQCPYGLQMQRLALELFKYNPDLKNHIKFRFIGSVESNKAISMHGEKEAEEDLRQVCIREENAGKYWDYASCYIKKGDSVSCLNSADINEAENVACVSDANRGLKYIQEDFKIAKERGVSGSPTVYQNGEKASESWFGGRTAEAVKTLVCCGFSSKPDDCSKTLTAATAASGFSETYASEEGSASSAKCN